MPVYKNGNSFEKYFTVNKAVYDEQQEQCGLEIMFISWEGTPLGKISLHYPSLRGVDIDMTNGHLYAIDFINDEIIRVDINDF